MVARAQRNVAQAISWYAESLGLSNAVGDRLQVARSLEGMAALALDEAQAPSAARLFSAATHLRTLFGSAMNAADTGGYERDVRVLREALGDAAFSAEWEAGATLDIEEMVAQVGGPRRC